MVDIAQTNGGSAPPSQCLFHARERSRRDILSGVATAAMACLVPFEAAKAAEEPTTQFGEAYKKLLAERQPKGALVRIDVPELAENGNMVPFAITVDSPMTPDDHVTTITILSTGNPQPVIAQFQLSPASGRAAVSGRLRLARSQDIIVLAEANSGDVWSAQANVKVTVGGCGAG